MICLGGWRSTGSKKVQVAILWILALDSNVSISIKKYQSLGVLLNIVADPGANSAIFSV